MVLNAAVQMLREADELKQKILKFKSGTSMLQERSLWVSQQQLQKVYQKVLVLDLDYALDKKVEQDLWNIGFKQQIEALQAISKDRKNPLRSEGQAMLSWVLQAAAGFYLCLLHQICTTFKLDLPFRRRASLLGFVEGWGAESGGGRAPPPAAARYICQHCLVHLGDLARYRQQLRQAHTFYRHALVVSAHSGQPYNQLALVAWRRGRRLGALYWHVRSVLVRAPFPPAPANLARTLRAATATTRYVHHVLGALYWHVRSVLVRAPFPPAPANLARTLRAATATTRYVHHVLGALYWHVRSVLVRAPFPPAPANLARTLRAATATTRYVHHVLGALYWHVRSVLVRAPFPPAPANLARTLRAATATTRYVHHVLGALYWHVRSVLVRAPFPPAPANLARTLRAATATTRYVHHVLGALYWHVRSVLVRAPFPPAPANLARTLRAATATTRYVHHVLGALYWHVRSVLVRAPFPPAPANLARTLRAATATTRYVHHVLGALYWHVRSVLVRAPFPPAPANLARTLRAATATTRYVHHVLGALYWHVRSVLVRAPFPPAPANLARTLRAATATTRYVHHVLGALYWHVRSVLVRAPFPPAPANLARTLRAATATTRYVHHVLGALYWHVRSVLVRAPFPPAPANLARTLRAATATTRYVHHVLGALYWHVRSVLVRAPFPPAPANLARTLRAATTTTSQAPLPVLPGLSPRDPQSPAAPARLDAQSYVAELLRAIHLIHTVDDLETAAAIVKNLNSSLTVLVATDSFEPMTLIKMACVLIWLVHSSTEDLKLEPASLSAAEAQAVSLAHGLCVASVLALALPAYSSPAPKNSCLPALKVWLSWLTSQAGAPGAWAGKPALWPALAHTLTLLHENQLDKDTYDTVPLPEDEELHGFLPLEASFKGLRFANYACWDTYGGRLPDLDDQDKEDQPPEVSTTCLSNEPELEHRLRARRLVLLGKKLTELCGEHLSYTEENGVVTFSAARVCGAQLSQALAALAGAGAERDDEPAPRAPRVISEADFREKVREKRVGILKPQGSLERAREERAMATQDDPEPEDAEDSNKMEDKKEARKPRVNIAMAAIMRKQEETNKQVKFVTPPPTPDSVIDTESKDEKPKVIQPKPMKSLANLPIGRKTGGILSLKDKSAGYPHLVNTDPEPKKEREKEEKREPKSPVLNPNPQKRQEHPPTSPQATWGPNMATQTYNEPRMNFQKNYGIQNAGISYNPSYQPPGMGNNIRLPVVNPKEIDVRTAALQKQNSRQELFQDGHKFNHNYQISGDKKNFLNDLPPRFANQYKYWQSPQDNENKFRDDTFKNQSLFNQQPNWMNPQESYQPTWWKPDQPFNTNFSAPSMSLQSNFYTPHPTSNMQSYQNMPYNQSQAVGQSKEGLMGQNYMQSTIGQPQLQALQNLVSSPNFNSSLNSFSYPTVGYDSAMYPQFSKMSYQPLPAPKPQGYPAPGAKELDPNPFGSMEQRGLNFNEPLNEPMKNMDQIGSQAQSRRAGSTYSLFSGAPEPGWAPQAARAHPHQSLWSGPGPSPLERLLEQQKQIKQPPPPQ